MMKALFAVAAVAGVSMLNANPVSAQVSCGGINTCNVAGTASLTIPQLVAIDGATGSVTLTAPTSETLGTAIATTGPTFTVKANRAWALTLQSAAADFTYAGTDAGAKAAADVSFSNAANGTFSTLATTAATITTGSRSNGQAVTVYFQNQTSGDYTDASNRPGTYTLGMTFTITAQ